MTDYKTLRVPEDAWEEAKAQKEDHGRTWGEQIVRPDADAHDGPTVTVPKSVVRDAVADAMSEVEIHADVDLGEMDTGGDVSEEDVRAWIEDELQKNVAERVLRQ